MIDRLLKGLANLFQSKLGSWIAGAMVFLGIGFATQQAVIEPAIDQVQGYIQSAGSEAGAVAMQWFGFLNMDKAITMILSAYAARAAIRAAKVFLTQR